MASSSSAPPLPRSWNAAIHLSDPAFTSRVDFADAYVLPTSGTPTPTAVLVSPWLLTTPPPITATMAAGSTSVGASASVPVCVETVPLAWRCPTCGSLEVEQLFWRRPPPQRPCLFASSSNASRINDNEGFFDAPAAAAARRRAALARVLRLQGLSPAMKAKLERHRRRRERREEMRWRSLYINPRCLQCFLCPRCGGHQGSSSSSSAPSVAALDVCLTKDLRYFTVCRCCQWHSYQAFPSMEQLLSYLDSSIGEDKAEAMRDWRASQRSANAALRSRLHEMLHGPPYDEVEGVSEEDVALRGPPKATVSQAAWEKYRQLTRGAQRGTLTNTPRGDLSPRERERRDFAKDEADAALLTGLHPALALEELRRREAARRASTIADNQAMCVPPGAVQATRAVGLGQEAWMHFYGLANDVSRLTNAAAASEVGVIVSTQQSILGLRAEAVDTRQLTLLEWMQRYQPAAFIAQQRKAAAAAAAAASPASPTRTAAQHVSGSSPSAIAAFLSALPDKTPAKVTETPVKLVFSTPAATTVHAPATSTPGPRNVTPTPSMSALYHTPTSAYLQSLLLREDDHALGLPAYCVPRSRKELLTGLVWRLRPTAANTADVSDGGGGDMDEEMVSIHGRSVPCTRVVVLNRPALSDREVQRVYEHWAQLLEKQAERLCAGQQPQEKMKIIPSKAAGAQAGGGAGSDSEGDEAEVEDILTADAKGLSGGGASAKRQGGSARTTAAAVTTATSSEVSAALARKRKKSALPPPLFLDGSDFAVTGALPCWHFMGCGPANSDDGSTLTGEKEAQGLEWHFRLINVHLQHDLYVTKLAVCGVSVRGDAKGNESKGNSVRGNVNPSSLKLLLSTADAPSLQLPVVLRSQCSPEERALLAQSQPLSAAMSTPSSSPPQPSPPSSAQLSCLSPEQSAASLPSLREMIVTIRMPADAGVTAGDNAHTSSPGLFSVYVALAMEVLTPLPEVSALPTLTNPSTPTADGSSCRFIYHTVQCGVTVLLTST